MSNGAAEPQDGPLDDPVRLLDTGRSAVRAHIDGTDGVRSVGREVFQQAEAIFGGREVPRAEFASWLHFAAKVLGHDAYAERIAAAEPGMPWRAVWAWWRPVGKCVAHPNLSYAESLLVHAYEGRQLLRVKASWEDTWLDLETGERVPAPPEGAAVPRAHRDPTESVPCLGELALSAPESWGEARPLVGEDGRVCHLIDDVHGLALVDTDPAVLRDWPRGELDHTSSEEGTPGKAPVFPDPDGPLTAARLDEAFAPTQVVRIPEDELPAGLEHAASRAHLRDIGLPEWWACAWTTFDPYPPNKMTPPDESSLKDVTLPDGLEASDLLALGSSEHGELYLHRREGTIHISAAADELGATADGEVMVEFAPDLDLFTRCLEGVRRYMNACWHPYPDEQEMGSMFLMEMDGHAPDCVDADSPSSAIWSYFVAGITELNEDGF
ncbi:hypothetical protein FCH28_34345 [Streptomyces piniterrae]|uniref:Uncharacterized protein n=1 Tax=Streptomyces piniterrae TaxID=2571125 RepID=A0A4V5MHR6_9ACTN|nr:SUKH-4 family immunity protein [Streptomyces piniterrae]TJZ42488.1 hypothetical protein FCH28_34345 [Streptomyces piniterrae]